MDDDSPYRSPRSSAERVGSDDAGPKASFSSDARAIFLAWERLRLLYNAVLIVVTVGVAVAAGGTALLGRVPFWMDAVVGGVVANVCYLVGPIVESYLAWLGIAWRGFRPLCFVLGTLVVAFAATMVVIVAAMPSF